jgi:hypothetical protein
MWVDGAQEHLILRSTCLAMIAMATAPLAQATSAVACSRDKEVQAHIAIVEREPGYALTALRACPDRYCASFGRRLLIFGMTANVATVATICPAELAAICATEVATICALQAQPPDRVTAAPATRPQ